MYSCMTILLFASPVASRMVASLRILLHHTPCGYGLLHCCAPVSRFSLFEEAVEGHGTGENFLVSAVFN